MRRRLDVHESWNDTRMKTRLIAAVSVMIAAAGLVWVLRQSAAPPGVEIRLRSDPFPMTVGRADLWVALEQAGGSPVEGAQVQVAAQMLHPGMPALWASAEQSGTGAYRALMTWPMTGQWVIDVTAELPGQQSAIQEQFEVFVYAAPPSVSGSQTTYRSQSETRTAIMADPAREYWIVIPQGTRQMLLIGEDHNLMPDELRLQASGRNVLVIRNDDIADHNIGPFFVRAGETVRQKFTQPAVFTGTCSIRHSDEIRIVVEA